MAAVLLLCLTVSLGEEVGSFLEEYSFQGYARQWSRPLYLPLGEPCTLWVFAPESLEGVMCGVGGEAVLDLSMELMTPELNITDEFPDDLPVLRFSTQDHAVLIRVVVEAVDMLYGATADSAYVFCAMRETQIEDEILNPAVPDSTIQGE